MGQKQKTELDKTQNFQGGQSIAKPKLKRKEYEEEIAKLHIQLVKLQFWVKRTGARIIVLFEGRDAAGKGGVIKRITERVNPRVFRVVALPAPSERERSQIYFQRNASSSSIPIENMALVSSGMCRLERRSDRDKRLDHENSLMHLGWSCPACQPIHSKSGREDLRRNERV